MEEQLDMPKGSGAFISALAIVAWCLMSLAVVLVSWALGGTEYKDSIFGNVAVATCVAGIVGGNILLHWARHQNSHH